MTKEEVSHFIISSFSQEQESDILDVELLGKNLAKKHAVDVPVSNVTVFGARQGYILRRMARS